MRNANPKLPLPALTIPGALAIALVLALLLLLSGGIGGTGGGPATAEAGCGKLKVKSTVVSRYPKIFADQYEKKLKVSVQRGGGSVRDWRVQLYTFGGFLLGQSKIDDKMSSTDTAKMKLKLPLQPGKYTMVTKGTVGGCGELELDEVVNFRGCLNKLPIDFVAKPSGSASDYGRYLSVKIQPKSVWAPLVDIYGTLSNFDGDVYGKAELPQGERKLIGQQFLNFKLKSGGLDRGGYSVFVTGKARQPRSCGNLAKSTDSQVQVALGLTLLALLLLGLILGTGSSTPAAAQNDGPKFATQLSAAGPITGERRDSGRRGKRGYRGHTGPEGNEGPLGPRGIAAGPARQFISIDWQNGDYVGRDRQSFTAPGIGTGEVRCTPPNGNEPTGVQWIHFYPDDNGTPTTGPSRWNTTMWTARMGGDVGDPNSDHTSVVRTARLDRPNQVSGFNESMNTITEGTVQESAGSFTGIITTEPLNPAISQPPATTFNLTWYWKFNDGSPRCYMAGTFVTKGT